MQTTRPAAAPDLLPGPDRALRVLVIDDEDNVRNVYGDFLEALGHQPDLAADGVDGLRRFARNRHDLVLTDMLMPGLSGIEVVRTLRRADPDLPIIVISGSADPFDVRQFEHGSITFLRKPVGLAEFERAIEAEVSPRSGGARYPAGAGGG
jgi:CheY-like chemotaxis protein